MNEMVKKEMGPETLTMPELVKQAQEGNREAFGQLYVRYKETILVYCLRLLHNPDDAEDLVQDVFALAFTKLASLKEPAAFLQWLRRITINKFIERNRKMKKLPMEQVVEWDPIQGGDALPVFVAMRHERINCVREAITTMGLLDDTSSRKRRPTSCALHKILLWESYVDGKSQAEVISLHSDIPEGTIKRTLYNGRKKIAVILRKRGMDAE